MYYCCDVVVVWYFIVVEWLEMGVVVYGGVFFSVGLLYYVMWFGV